MHGYDHHIGDYTKDTIGLAMLEDGCYRRLLDHYYATELPLPKQKPEVYRIARATSAGERKAVEYVLSRYFDLREDGWHNNRADKEIGAFQGKSESATNAAHERWARHRRRLTDANADANASPTAYPNADANAYPNADADGLRTQCIGNANPRVSPPSILHPPSSGKPPNAREPPAAFAPPDWVPRREWDDFDEMRRRKSGKAWTARAKEMAVEELAKLMRQGHDPTAVLRQSVMRTWSGVFPVDQPKGGASKATSAGRATVASGIFEIGTDEEPTDITGESQRVG